MKLVLATSNPDKLSEIQDLMRGFELLPRPHSIPDVDESESTFEGNARLKAVAIAEATGLAAVADDSGLEVDALNGAPGVHSARYAGDDRDPEDNIAKLLAELDGVSDDERTARFRCVAFVYFPDGLEVVASGSVEGVIAKKRKGQSGFGYDPVFIPTEGDGRTFAQMTSGEKHAISHRGRAFRNLRELLN